MKRVFFLLFMVGASFLISVEVTSAEAQSGLPGPYDCGAPPLPPCSEFPWVEDLLNPVEGNVQDGLIEGKFEGDLNPEAANDLCGSGQWRSCRLNSDDETTSTNNRQGSSCTGVGEFDDGGLFGAGTIEGCGTMTGGDQYQFYYYRTGLNSWVRIW
jgi:hypothetical protein